MAKMISFLATDEDLKNIEALKKRLGTGIRGKSKAIREALRLALKVKAS